MRSCLYSLSIISFLLLIQFYPLSWPVIKQNKTKQNKIFKLVVANLPSILMKKRSDIRRISLPTTSIAPFWVLLQYFQVLGYKQIFFSPTITDYNSPSHSLYSPPHTGNPWPPPYTKPCTTECSQASLNTCPLQPKQSRSLIYSPQSFTSSSLLHASLSPTAPLPDTNPTEGKPSGCSLLQDGHCPCPEGSKRQQWCPSGSTEQVTAGCTNVLWNELAHSACFPRIYRYKRQIYCNR